MESLYEMLNHCTVRIADPAGQEQGTGFFIAPDLVVTCAHVVNRAYAEATPVALTWRTQEEVPPVSLTGRVTAWAEGPDLALVHVEPSVNHPCVWLSEEYTVADPLYSFGYPSSLRGRGLSMTFAGEGWAESLDHRWLLTFKEELVEPGVSGAALLNQRTGGVCGIIAWTKDAAMVRGGHAILASAIWREWPELQAVHQAYHQQRRDWQQCRERHLGQIANRRESSMTFWHVPYRRNPYFIGREQLFQQLHTTFSSRQGIVTQALTGLGGIGKTQTALEYAYRNQHAYQAIFWVSVETRAVLLGDFLKLAEVLDLPEHEVQDQEKIVAAVRHWLETHERWLLILDNSEDVALAQELLPTKGQGHILLTTRDAATGTAALGLPLEVLPEDEGISFLLRRAKILPETEKVASLDASLRQKAQAIVQEVGGLPLALDQAGAYIEETNCGLADYLALYQQHSKEILRRRGRLVTDHPDPVTVTWALSFKQIKLASKAAADLLYCCAYLFSEGIPESFFAEAASELPPTLRRAATDPLRWNGTLEVLRHYSLLGRQPENKTLSLHRLVQVVLRADLKKPAERRWVERVVRMLNTLFPDPDDAAGWPTCQRYLPHAQVAAQLMKQTGLTLLEGPRLLNHAGQYLQERGLYPEAKPYHEQALSIQEQSLGPVHPEIAASLHELAALSWHQELDDQAIAYNQRALSIRRQTLEPLHPDIARSLTGLAASYAGKGDNDSAVPLLQEAIAIWEQVLGRDHPDVATGINNLAGIYVSQGQYDQAEALYQRALGILEQDLESHGPKVGMLLDNMAKLYAAQGKYEQAEPLYQQAIALKEQWLGSMHPNLATSFSHLAKLYVALGNYEQAEAYYRKAIEIFEQALGPAYAPTQEALEDYVSLLRLAQREAEAVVIEKRLKVVKEVPT